MDREGGRFIKTLLIAIGVLAAVIMLVSVFLSGQRAAIQHSFVHDSAVAYTARQSGTSEAQLAKNQNLLDEGYIPEQEYNSRKDNQTSKKE